MANFYDLTVTDIHRTIRDAVVLTLQPADETSFQYTQGQYLTFRRDFDGEELRRSYSICTGRDEGKIQVGIKKVEGGAFSNWANTDIRVGDVVQAMAPMGSFHDGKASGGHILAFAGGAGITPILSVLRTELSENTDSTFTLVYANQSVNTIMFKDEIEDLKNQYLSRLNVIHILEHDGLALDLFKGRIDAEKCAKLFQTLIDPASVDRAYICGPEPMMLAIVDALKSYGLSKEQIRFELFASGQQGRVSFRPSASTENEIGVTATVTLDGDVRTFVMSRDTSLLEAARMNKVDAPFACKAGVCSTCKAKVLDGNVEMIANHALEDYEVRAGYVLTCQCYAISDTVTWDYDQAGH